MANGNLAGSWIPARRAVSLFIAELFSSRIRKVTLDGVIHTVAGNGSRGFGGDGGSATSASLWGPEGVAVDTAGRKRYPLAKNVEVVPLAEMVDAR